MRTPPDVHDGLPAESWAESLCSSDEAVQRKAAGALVHLGRHGVPHLEAVLLRGGLLARITAAIGLQLLVKQGEPSALDALARASLDEDPVARFVAAKNLADVGADAVPVLTEVMYADELPGLRELAGEAVARITGSP